MSEELFTLQQILDDQEIEHCLLPPDVFAEHFPAGLTDVFKRFHFTGTAIFAEDGDNRTVFADVQLPECAYTVDGKDHFILAMSLSELKARYQGARKEPEDNVIPFPQG